MSATLLLGIDAGTTAVKAGVFDDALRPVSLARRAVRVAHPHEGWVEQDPEEILAAVQETVGEALAEAGSDTVVAAGLDHQGESVLAWDAETGRALTPVVVWQDKRQASLLATLDGPLVSERSGLPLDPYFSAGKLAWLLESDATVASAAQAGTLRLGTVDAFLVNRLSGGFQTDLSTASRTQFLALGGSDWDELLLGAFGVPRDALPAIVPTFGSLGELLGEGTLKGTGWSVPLAAQVVDQQAALAGTGAVLPGAMKATYGTGVFVLGRTDGPARCDGLLPTVAWAGAAGEVAYALDGGVFAAGSLLEWLAHGLGLAADAPALAASAAGAPDSAGVSVLPAISGLGAPWWRADARGVIAGLHPGVRPPHLARAALYGICARMADIVEAFSECIEPSSITVDGGLTRERTLVQMQADVLGMPLTVAQADATVLGAAMLAGVGAGVFASVEEAAERLAPGHVVTPRTDARERRAERERWKAFVRASLDL